jgi:hypothetical protein
MLQLQEGQPFCSLTEEPIAWLLAPAPQKPEVGLTCGANIHIAQASSMSRVLHMISEVCCYQSDYLYLYPPPNIVTTHSALLVALGGKGWRCKTHGACEGYS